jgi:hypothetical protein
MKKYLRSVAGILGGILILTLLFGSTSCKKCRECTAYDYEGFYYHSDEYCSTGPAAGRNVDDWEDTFRSTWWDYNVTCTDN